MIRSMLAMSCLPAFAINVSRRVRGEIDEQSRIADTAALCEVLHEESSRLHVDTHSREDDREIVLVIIVNSLCSTWPMFDETSLPANLSGNLMIS